MINVEYVHLNSIRKVAFQRLERAKFGPSRLSLRDNTGYTSYPFSRSLLIDLGKRV